MKKIDLEELKTIELDMLKYLDKLCVENDIPYFICGGTLIGALRHGGFIPWDDDIDVAIPRNYYAKLKATIENEPSCYKLAFFDNSDSYGYSMPKLFDTRTKLVDYKLGSGKEEISVFIDVFLFDGLNDSKLKANIRFCVLRCIKRMVFLSRRSFKMESLLKTIFFAIPCLICKIIGTKKLNYILNNLAARIDFYSTDFVGNISGRYGMREIIPREYIEDVIRVEFENTFVNAPIGYDKWLKAIYGNYLELPPIDKRVSNHTSDEWWK